MQMRRLFQHKFVMTRLMSMVKETHTLALTATLFTTGDLQPRPTSMHQDCHNPQTPKHKTHTHTPTHKETKKQQRHKAKRQQVQASSTPLKRPLADGHGIIEWKHITSQDKPIQHGLDFTTLASHSATLGLEGWTRRIWEGDGHGNVRMNFVLNELCFDIFGGIWDFICIQHLHLAPTAESSNLSSNFASMDIINVRVTVDICLGGWFNLFCIHWKY
ncbi:hypothetical protein PENPOL_c001G04798 [Penicillium polonicum]|uniref:Uncharacterized protein n=1 Tax=Penicillium polonicum TaxID=60169 RepID=A0A1V6P241_PENPO|nr:hypothetical protein PENPOL_c001G04798 [Penicillium polonicum]